MQQTQSGMGQILQNQKEMRSQNRDEQPTIRSLQQDLTRMLRDLVTGQSKLEECFLRNQNGEILHKIDQVIMITHRLEGMFSQILKSQEKIAIVERYRIEIE